MVSQLLTLAPSVLDDLSAASSDVPEVVASQPNRRGITAELLGDPQGALSDEVALERLIMRGLQSGGRFGVHAPGCSTGAL